MSESSKTTSDESRHAVDYNRAAWDAQVEKGNRWTVPATPDQIQHARDGKIEIVLTPTKPIPMEWLMPLDGKDVLCLAGGGGQQAPMLAAAGANVTTLDNSQRQLDQDQVVATREGLELRSVHGLMEDLSPLENESFDLIVHPCSNSFTPNLIPVWNEAFRVLRPGGNLLSGFFNPIFFLFDFDAYERKELIVKHRIPYSDFTDLTEAQKKTLIDQDEPLLFGHSLQDQIGGQTRAGFQLTGFFEDDWGDADDPLSKFIDSFIATRATKPPPTG